MNNVDEVIQVITICLIVAGFLLNTNRFLKAIELCKECLFILKDAAGLKDKKIYKSFYKWIYFKMWNACSIIGDNSSAIEYAEKLLQLHRESGERLEECKLSIYLAGMFFRQSKYAQAEQIFEKALLISNEIGYKKGEATCYANLGNMYESVSEYEKAREQLQKSLSIMKEVGDKNGEANCYTNLGIVYKSLREYEKAREHQEKSLAIMKEVGDKNGEANCYGNLGIVYQSVGEYDKAREHLQKSLAIMKEVGDKNGEANCYNNLGNMYGSVGEYEMAREYHEKSLSIMKKVGDKNGEANCYTNFGIVYKSVGEYGKAREHHEKSLAIMKEVEDKNGEANCYTNLGIVYQSLGEYEKAREHLQKSLAIMKEVGDKNGEANCYGNLGNVYQAVGEYEKAREHLQKSLVIMKEVGHKNGEASCYVNLGNVYESVGEYEKAREHHEKSLAIMKEVGDKNGEANCFGSLGNVYKSVGEYEKARKHHEKSLSIMKEVGDRRGEACSYVNLASLYSSVGEYEKDSDYLERSLAVSKKIGDRRTLAISYSHLGIKFYRLGKYNKANEYNKKALLIFRDIGNRESAAYVYMTQGAVEHAVGSLINAKDYFEKALAISKELGNRHLEAGACLSLGRFFYIKAEYVRAEEYIKKGLTLSEEIGDIATQSHALQMMANLRIEDGKIQEAISYFLSCIEKCEKMRDSLCDHDQFKISFSDCNTDSYRILSSLLCETGNLDEALHVLELLRARALVDLMSARYSVENKISLNPRTWAGIKDSVAKDCNGTCLYVSYCGCSINLWILKGSEVTDFRVIKGKNVLAREGSTQHLEQFFDLRSFGFLPEGLCEDGSLHGFQPQSKSCEDDCHEGWRIGKESKANQGPKINLPVCYKLIIAPVRRFLEGPEIIIVPDRALYQIPFAALTDESGKYLSEIFRIRVIPSLTTLKLIKDSAIDHHCHTGALVVGNPDVGEVHFKGRLTNISRLPCAENEARMVGEKLGVEPLLGQQATKQAVLQAMNSVALIHVAAHGDAERGEIALAPSFRIPNGIPQEGLYLLTMSDISNIQLRAKLVVLSCCHSARGRTKAEGAVGIARAFLGSGARSVLVALWALHDKATEQLMTHFYDHLVAGESAGKSLHEAMKWMRSEGYGVNEWAPFILIGDDVTFDFGK